MSIALMTSFDEYYEQLAHREWTLNERLNAVKRDEVGGRERIVSDEQAAFADVLHLAGVMIGDKKRRESRQKAACEADEHGRPRATRGQLAPQRQQLTVWTPALQPRALPRPAGRPQLAFPHAAYTTLCGEERELRNWLHGVERRLREHVEQACARSWFLLTCLQKVVENEQRARARVMRDEYEQFSQMRRRVFLLAPADYFRQEAIRRHGVSRHIDNAAGACDDAAREGGVEGVVAREAAARAVVEAGERASHEQLRAYVDEMYKTRMFMINHQEIVGRLAIEDAARDAVYPLIERHCRASFGLPYHRTAAVVLHGGGGYCAVRMQQLCMSQYTCLRSCAAAFAQSYTKQQQEVQAGENKPWEYAMREKLSAEEMSSLLLQYCDENDRRRQGSLSSKRMSVCGAPTPAAAARLLPVKSAGGAGVGVGGGSGGSGKKQPTLLSTGLQSGGGGKASTPAGGAPASPSDTGLTPTPGSRHVYSAGASAASTPSPVTSEVLVQDTVAHGGAAAGVQGGRCGSGSGGGVLRRENSISNSIGNHGGNGKTGSPLVGVAIAAGTPSTAAPATTGMSGRRSSPRVTITTATMSASPHRVKRSSFHAFVSDEDNDSA